MEKATSVKEVAFLCDVGSGCWKAEKKKKLTFVYYNAIICIIFCAVFARVKSA